MNWRETFSRMRQGLHKSGQRIQREGERAGQVVRDLLDSFNDEWIEQAFDRARKLSATDLLHLPVDFQLRQSAWPRRLYEKVFPISHVFRLSYRHNGEFLEDFMPITNESYIGRGTYKFVYRLPWQMVVKVGKDVLGSDPIFGSLYRDVVQKPDFFLTPDELRLMEHLQAGRAAWHRERTAHKFYRLGLERYHYWKVREALPDLVLPTKFFMGVRYRKRLNRDFYSRKIMPMESQVLLVGKHLKEFAQAGRKSRQSWIGQKFSPHFDFEFNIGRFGHVKKSCWKRSRPIFSA